MLLNDHPKQPAARREPLLANPASGAAAGGYGAVAGFAPRTLVGLPAEPKAVPEWLAFLISLGLTLPAGLDLGWSTMITIEAIVRKEMSEQACLDRFRPGVVAGGSIVGLVTALGMLLPFPMTQLRLTPHAWRMLGRESYAVSIPVGASAMVCGVASSLMMWWLCQQGVALMTRQPQLDRATFVGTTIMPIIFTGLTGNGTAFVTQFHNVVRTVRAWREVPAAGDTLSSRLIDEVLDLLPTLDHAQRKALETAVNAYITNHKNGAPMVKDEEEPGVLRAATLAEQNTYKDDLVLDLFNTLQELVNQQAGLKAARRNRLVKGVLISGLIAVASGYGNLGMTEMVGPIETDVLFYGATPPVYFFNATNCITNATAEAVPTAWDATHPLGFFGLWTNLLFLLLAMTTFIAAQGYKGIGGKDYLFLVPLLALSMGAAGLNWAATPDPLTGLFVFGGAICVGLLFGTLGMAGVFDLAKFIGAGCRRPQAAVGNITKGEVLEGWLADIGKNIQAPEVQHTLSDAYRRRHPVRAARPAAPDEQAGVNPQRPEDAGYVARLCRLFRR